MNRLVCFSRLLQDMGWKYSLFRIIYELQRRSGLLRLNFPISVEIRRFVTLEDWRKKTIFFFSEKDIHFTITNSFSLETDLQHILKEECYFFSSFWIDLGRDYDWITNPETGYQYDIFQHWTEIEDISEKAGDIKFVWEKSRFSFLYSIIRFDYHFKEDHSQKVLNLILDWIDKNPLNCGPNYKCSQEISVRVLNWIFALNYYKDSSFLTEDKFQRIIHSIYWQIKHVYSNINFSRIAVRNNHAITETLTLYIVGLLFPQFPDSEKWKRKGKHWFEEEIEYQIAEDGTYLQFSMNYHRVVVQLLTWAIALADRHKEVFKDIVYQKAYQSINFLYQCQELSNGYLPNYGANDGALFFKLNDADYKDYRPQLDALHYLLTGTSLYEIPYEDRFWYTAEWKCDRNLFPPLSQKKGLVCFQKSGYYLIREQETLTFIRCGKYKTRPSHADNLHIDIWYRGENVLMDGGSYKYNTEPSLIKYFAGTESHNTVMLGQKDQILKGPRFIWYYWSQAINASFWESSDSFCFTGIVSCFGYLDKKIKHIRKVVKIKDKPEWIIEDRIENKPKGLDMRQIWHTRFPSVKFESANAIRTQSKGSFSFYYGAKTENIQIEFSTTSNTITTNIQIF